MPAPIPKKSGTIHDRAQPARSKEPAEAARGRRRRRVLRLSLVLVEADYRVAHFDRLLQVLDERVELIAGRLAKVPGITPLG